ncbi:uncharacterized protein LOC128219299 [Mya arenaria]|uniref:uncharacterized protein LOC128219299 n=1 Tax=Mya arenaria TaxID=6604 RepID=UPI0022E268A8|nr:uncharacterized protein LOC128219299 [Mya arenaria]
MADMRNSPREVASYLRKVRKPLVERQRRERMNASIDRLKLLIADTIREQVSPMTRVDKADVLELTVFYLTRLQQQQRSGRVATEATDTVSYAKSYQTGSRKCAREAVNYIASSSRWVPEVGTGVSGHLRSVYMRKQNSRQDGDGSLHDVDNRIPQIDNIVPYTYTHQGQNQHDNFMSTPIRSDERLNGLTGRKATPSMNTPECSPILQKMTSHGDVNIHNSRTAALSFQSSDSGFASLDMSTFGQSLESECGNLFDQSEEAVVGQLSKDNVWRPW